MKTPKRISSKRPSLWKCRESGVIRAFYPSGYVELYNQCHGEWDYSFFSEPDPEMVIDDLKNGNIFLGYL